MADNDDFEDFLSMVRPDEPEIKEGWEKVLCSDRPGRFPVHFWCKTSKVSLDSVLGKIIHNLSKCDHPLTDHPLELARLILGLFSRMRRDERSSAIETFNSIFDLVDNGDVNYYCLLFDPNHEIYELSLGPYKVGKLDAEKFRHHCKRAGSDWFNRYGEEIDENWSCVSREFQRIKIIDWVECFQKQLKDSPKFLDDINELAENFRSRIAQYFSFNVFKEELNSHQIIPRSITSGFFDFDKLIEHFATRENHFVCILLNVGKSGKGGVYSQMLYGVLNFGSSKEMIEHASRSFKQHLKIDVCDINNLPQIVKSFFHFMNVARSHESDNRISEAFLHLIIALEIVFVENKESLSKTVSQRVAVLSHSALGVGLKECKNKIENLYGVRSKYVHAGKEASLENLKEAFEICSIIAFVLLRNISIKCESDDRFEKKWFQGIDMIWDLDKNDENIDEDRYYKLGVAKAGGYDIKQFWREYYEMKNASDSVDFYFKEELED